MKIAGLQKTTLIDYPGQIAATLFLYGCNFRCGFCYNADLVTKEAKGSFKEEEILAFLDKRKGKLNAVCITGGEPLLTLTESFLKKIKDLGYLVKIDTNGTNPRKLKNLIEKGLVDYVAMDIKGSKEDYDIITGVKVNINDIEETIMILKEFENYEFRTTTLEEFHNSEKIESIGKWLGKLMGEKPYKYFLQGFKKDGDFIDPEYKKKNNTSEKYLKDLKKTADNYFQTVGIRW